MHRKLLTKLKISYSEKIRKGQKRKRKNKERASSATRLIAGLFYFSASFHTFIKRKRPRKKCYGGGEYIVKYYLAFLIASELSWRFVNGNIELVTEAALGAARGAVQVCFDLVGIMALWLGIMKIAEKGGLITGLAKLLKPFMQRLFPSIPAEHPAMGAIILNLSANVLGLGNAATPFGMKAMQELQSLTGKRRPQQLCAPF